MILWATRLFCKRKICSRRGEESLAISAFQKSGKTIDKKEKSKSQDFKENNLKNESILCTVPVSHFSSQNFKDKIAARKQMDKDNFIEYQGSTSARYGLKFGK